jgi:hypothetical protein
MTTLKRTELIQALTRVRAEMQTLLDDLSETHLLQPGAVGEWTVRDVLAHITAWEVDMLTNLGKVRRGAKPGNTAWTSAAIERQNEAWHKEMKDRPLRQVLADFEGARKQTLRVLEGLSDAEAAKPAAWLQGRPLAQYVATMTLDHEREHLEHLRRWQGRVTASGGGTEPNGHGPQVK